MIILKDKSESLSLLFVSATLLLLSLPFRLFKKRNSKRVIFFGQMNGNTKALANYIEKNDSSIEMYYLAYPKYLKVYKKYQNISTLSMLKFRDVIKVVKSDVILTNYGVSALVILVKLTNIKFIESYHGILLFKKLPKIHAKLISLYNEVWVSSQYMKKIYKNDFDVNSTIVPVGYARVDKLINHSYTGVKEKYSIPKGKKVIMLAPTWQMGSVDSAELPLEMQEDDLIAYLASFATRTNSFIVFRSHMYGRSINQSEAQDLIRPMPSNIYPDSEELLSVVDVLVTDWSSIALDFLVLNRPIIFIDKKPTDTKPGVVRGANPSGRFGDIVTDIDKFEKLVKEYLEKPHKYLDKYADSVKKVKKMAYGGNDDGKATERYYNRLVKLMTHK